MVRTAIKRKSESALPPGKLCRTELSISPSPSPETSFSDDVFVQDAPVAAKHVKKSARKSEPAPKTKADHEDDEDIGRTESQTFLALVEFESKKKQKANKENKGYMAKFEKCVNDQEGKLKMLLTEGGKMSNWRDTEFLETFKAAYGASRSHISVAQPSQVNGASSASSQDFAAMYKKSKEITTAAFALVAKFEEVVQRIERLDTTALIENEWGEQDEVFAGLLLEGKRIGVERYRRMLAASKEQALGEDDKVTADLFFNERDNVEGVWGKVVKKQEKALKKLVNTIEVQMEVA